MFGYQSCLTFIVYVRALCATVNNLPQLDALWRYVLMGAVGETLEDASTLNGQWP